MNRPRMDYGRQVCLNGHTVTTVIRKEPSSGKKRCTECGAETITECPKCHRWPIPGMITGGGSVYVSDLAKYCGECGEALPWTAARLQVAEELARQSKLTPEAKDELVQAIRDAAANGPKTEIAVPKIGKFLKEMGHESGKAMKDVLIQVLSSVIAKKLDGAWRPARFDLDELSCLRSRRHAGGTRRTSCLCDERRCPTPRGALRPRTTRRPRCRSRGTPA